MEKFPDVPLSIEEEIDELVCDMSRVLSRSVNQTARFTSVCHLLHLMLRFSKATPEDARTLYLGLAKQYEYDLEE